MSGGWKALAAKVAALTLRERIMLLAGVAVMLYGGWDRLAMQPWRARYAALEQELAQLQTSIADIGAKIAQIPAPETGDPDQQTRDEIQALQADIAAIEKKLKASSVDLIPPSEMAHVLEEFLARDRGLRLISLKNLSAAPLLAETLTQALKSNDDGSMKVFKHGLDMQLVGDYAGICRFLKAIEASPWRIYWEHLELKTENYPEIRVDLRVYTLSLDKPLLRL